MGFINEKDENGDWRTIDKEQNIVLREKSFDHTENITEFKLTIGEEYQIVFEGERLMSLNKQEKKMISNG